MFIKKTIEYQTINEVKSKHAPPKKKKKKNALSSPSNVATKETNQPSRSMKKCNRNSNRDLIMVPSLAFSVGSDFLIALSSPSISGWDFQQHQDLQGEHSFHETRKGKARYDR